MDSVRTDFLGLAEGNRRVVGVARRRYQERLKRGSISRQFLEVLHSSGDGVECCVIPRR